MARPDVFISCAEASGDMHAGGLTRSLLAQRPSLQIAGIGGPKLAAGGADVWHDTVSKARFGLTSFLRAGEVLKMLKDLRRRWQRDGAPRLVIGCDSWTMNKHVLKLAREFGASGMYYISPQVWASREGRVKKLAELTKAVACILPFEEQWLRDRGVNATFVGHPLFDHVGTPLTDGVRFPDRPPHIALNAGSRQNVTKSHLPGLLAAAETLRSLYPGSTFVSPVVPATEQLVRDAAPDYIDVRLDAFDEVIADCDLALTLSGTATLQTAAYHVPMVVVYRANRVLWETIGRVLIKTDTFSLVNLLHPRREHVVHELIPWNGKPEPLVAQAQKLLDDPAALRKQRRDLADVVEPLRKRGAGDAAAVMALGLLDGGKLL